MPTRKMVSYRLPPGAIAQLDLLVAALQARSLGKVSQADAIAWAISRAMAELADTEKGSKPEPAAKPMPVIEPIEEVQKAGADTPRKIAAIGGKLSREIELANEYNAAAERRREVDRLARESAMRSAFGDKSPS